MGLLGIAERVSHLGGTLTIESTAETGTALQVDLPLERLEPNVRGTAV
jgi:signal transduction histidine kinase